MKKRNGEGNEKRNENGIEICRGSHGGRAAQAAEQETALRTAGYLRLQTVQGAVQETVQEI